jgi:hypothetical protein
MQEWVMLLYSAHDLFSHVRWDQLSQAILWYKSFGKSEAVTHALLFISCVFLSIGDNEFKLIVCFSRIIANIFTQCLLVVPAYPSIPETHATFHQNKVPNFVISDCIFDTTHAYMHYNIHLVPSYTNESFLVTSLPSRQVHVEISTIVFKWL